MLYERQGALRLARFQYGHRPREEATGQSIEEALHRDNWPGGGAMCIPWEPPASVCPAQCAPSSSIKCTGAHRTSSINEAHPPGAAFRCPNAHQENRRCAGVQSHQALRPGAGIEEIAGVADAQFVEMATLRKRTLLAAALDEFLSSSDSEDDELFTIAAITGDCCGGKERPKVMNFVESVVRRFDNTEFRKHFRVARNVCYKVIADYEKSEFYPRGHGPYPRKTAEEHVLSFLWNYGKLVPDEVNYNLKLSQTRVRIENAFGLLKGRFRQLLYLEFWSVNKATQFILACCVLHNLCIDAGDTDIDGEEVKNASKGRKPGPGDAWAKENPKREKLLRQLGEEKRKKIAGYLRTVQ
ncbi:hypothetical protein HPB47_016068 [Ixodes persulcatus]|uniref:Uncharacterized protein n=1 Tax=Ixodes persulcatus TaxID=34615 RepID=A0AC60QU77_IXOPE|nr:hypothetical protein HPB47_016068 [Ixodes persulcatus]